MLCVCSYSSREGGREGVLGVQRCLLFSQSLQRQFCTLRPMVAIVDVEVCVEKETLTTMEDTLKEVLWVR